MANFRNLLVKVKEIIEGNLNSFEAFLVNFKIFIFFTDSYSENVDLARTTANLEMVVSKIIDDEEKKRKQ